MAALAGKIPARAIDTIRAAVLGNSGVAEAMLGNAQAAEGKLAESIGVIDRLASPELAELRRQVLGTWSEVIRKGGGDASALLARAAHAEHVHDENCGCGHAHDHHDEQSPEHGHAHDGADKRRDHLPRAR